MTVSDPRGGLSTSDLTSLVQEFSRTATAPEVAELLVKYVLHLTGARWAEVVETRGRRAAVLASTDIELSHRLLDTQQLSPGIVPPLPETHPVSETLVIADLRSDPRWPVLASYATEQLPVRSAILHYIAVEDRYAAGLAVYDDRPGYFTDEHTDLTRLVASIAGLALAGLSDARRADQLETALVSNRTIGTAVGILMSARVLTQPSAFARLVEVSQHTNRKLRDVAGDVIAGGPAPNS